MARQFDIGTGLVDSAVTSADSFLLQSGGATSHPFNFAGLPAGYWDYELTSRGSGCYRFDCPGASLHTGGFGFYNIEVPVSNANYTGNIMGIQSINTTTGNGGVDATATGVQYFFPNINGGSDVFTVHDPGGRNSYTTSSANGILQINNLTLYGRRQYRCGRNDANSTVVVGTAGTSTSFDIYATEIQRNSAIIGFGSPILNVYVSGAYYHWFLTAIIGGVKTSLATAYPWLTFSITQGTHPTVDTMTVNVTVAANGGGARSATIYLQHGDPADALDGSRNGVIFTINQGGGTFTCMETDSPRSWLHLGKGTAVSTLHLADYTTAFTSSAYAVDKWISLRSEPRSGKLAMLAKSGTSLLVYVSDDGGMSGGSVLSVTANSGVLERESEQGLLHFLWGDASNNVWIQTSMDGGTTWAAAVAVKVSGAQLVGTLISAAQDGRRGVITLLAMIGTTTNVLQSTDSGKTFTIKI